MTLADLYERYADAIVAESDARSHRHRVALRMKSLQEAINRAQLDLDEADDLLAEATKNTKEAKRACDRTEFERSMQQEPSK